ncbi:DUF4380 domain-containing protein [Stieleria sp. TO1_6]|uniref:DUF4380 domain-containing protein n=1 Tax=Stieleria tagensis TaxID=2956795 RepID=UPI00209AA652|nr:DUF4380 domain-containing protein [Stieleria tagensis]MCO8125247.1 DUF4380 domain-containing protein [Stieleria tagensis]
MGQSKSFTLQMFFIGGILSSTLVGPAPGSALAQVVGQTSRPPASQVATVDFGIYQDCPVLTNSTTRVVFCPQVGGRILEYSINGINALFVSQYELTGDASGIGGKSPSAGRFDIGPERIAPNRNEFFTGPWTVTAHGARSLQMTSQIGQATGVQLTRDFELDNESSRLVFKQTIKNVSDTTRQYCHWSRTFGNGAGIVLIPLQGFPRFRNRYVRLDPAGLQMEPKDETIRIRDGFLELLGPPKSPKLGMDSYAGWLAHQQSSGLLFIKQFPTYPDRNYCEGAAFTISTWTPASAHTVELEPIGPSEILAPGQSASFTEIWSLHENPFPGPGETFDLQRLQSIYDSLPATTWEAPQPDA